MESPMAFPESPMEQDEPLFPCKGCGEILEEGKAFELAGNRWHIDCFRCNTCQTLLDSDANLLLLSDGSLICNNCTYSCSACGNKIEDRAILAGEQAFCASCFRCRNCKRKIDDLKYARTSQGIFCMGCHESLMARRRKKSRAASSHQKGGSNAQSPMHVNKSLPSLPPSVATSQSTLVHDQGTPSETYDDTPTEFSPVARPPTSRKESLKSAVTQERSHSVDESKKGALYFSRSSEHITLTFHADNLALPQSSASKRNSSVSEASAGDGDPSNSFNITMVLDTGPVPGAFPTNPTPNQDDAQRGPPRRNSARKGSRTTERDYFNGARGKQMKSNGLEKQPESVSSSREQEFWSPSSNNGSPHIAYQERGRVPSADVAENMRTKDKTHKDHEVAVGSKASLSETVIDDTRVQHVEPRAPIQNGKTTQSNGDIFHLGEVPKGKKSGAASRASKSETQSPIERQPSPSGVSRSLSASKSRRVNEAQGRASRTASPASRLRQTTEDSPRTSTDSRKREEQLGDLTSPFSTTTAQLPKRGDSLQGPPPKSALSKPNTALDLATNTPPRSPHAVDHSTSASEAFAHDDLRTSSALATERKPGSTILESPPPASTDFPLPPPRAKDHTVPTPISPEDAFSSPRAAPPRPTAQLLDREGAAVAQSTDPFRTGEYEVSSGLPQYDRGDDFNMEADMARILGQNDESSNSLLRRVSNAVRHGRSFSDMENRTRASGKMPRSPGMNGSIGGSIAPEISSPTSVSPEVKENTAALKHELRRSAQKIAELQARVNSTADIQTLDTKLREKRSTVAFLATREEIMVRELEVLTEHVADAKNSQKPLDMDGLKSKIAREFALSLERVKETFAAEVEDLIHQKHQLVDENTNLNRLRDQAIQETEQLNSKNAQLADLNNELTQQIQERYRTHREHGMGFDSPKPPTNGLGIYGNHHKDKSDASMDTREFRAGSAYGISTPGTQTSLADQNEAEPATVLTAPHVINIRKGQAKKFNWKKGGQSVAKGMSKGLKGAFSSNAQHQQQQAQYSRDGRDGHLPEGSPYGMLAVAESPGNISRSTTDTSKQGLGFFGQKLGKGMPSKFQSNGNLVAVAAEGPQTLFGSDLVDRVEYEKRQIPSVVTRCIEEVELRGMDIEGIYRKTGGNSQVKAIQEGFERSDDYDISDPGLDITAVTSVLKQYFRRLPNPLLTFEAYDGMLESNSILDDEGRASFMRSIIQQLPPRHQDCLEFLIFHLARVAAMEKENLMTPKNLAVVFAPTLMRDHSIDREMTDMHSKNNAIQFLIENNKTIFGGS
ncbi:MAG: Rho-type gtpase-activating protein [Piccolia ochrophora]|nr:MAG: Rho-type gtpase-activating protein [Piccolia ochrophora]